MIDMLTSSGRLRASIPITSRSVYRKEIMGEEYVLLSFSLAEVIDFQKGDSIRIEEGEFEIVDIKYATVSKSTGGYEYELRFDHPSARWKNRILFYDRQNNQESSWSLTREIHYFLDIVVSNLRSAGFGSYSYEVSGDIDNKPQALTFDGTTIRDALNSIAGAWNTEWYVLGDTIHMGRYEFGEEVVLDKNILSEVSRQEGNNSNYLTRIYPFGSSVNLPFNYRGYQQGNVIEGISEKRLKLPQRIGSYLDARENMQTEDIIDKVVVFDGIYPRRIGEITEVRTVEREEYVENADGSTTTRKYNAYQFKDVGLQFSADYILEGQTLGMVFESGSLNGLTFSLIFNPEGKGENTEEGQWFEIVRNESYGTYLPNDMLYPQAGSSEIAGDRYTLFGINMNLVSGEYIPQAEEELYEAAKNYLSVYSKDLSVYNCTTNPVRCAGYVNGVYSARNIIDLSVGQRVRLYNDAYLGPEGKSSRIYSFEKKLDNPYDCTYQVGDTSAYSRIRELESRIDQVSSGATVSAPDSSSSTGQSPRPSSLWTLDKKEEYLYIEQDADDQSKVRAILDMDLLVKGNILALRDVVAYTTDYEDDGGGGGGGGNQSVDDLHVKGGINFYYNKSESPTSKIYETASGILNVEANSLHVNGDRVATINDVSTDYLNLFTNQSILGNKTFLNTIFTNGSLYTGGKTAAAIGIGVCVDALGALHISNATYPYISFYYANSTSYTSRIVETAIGTLRIYNNLNVTNLQIDGTATMGGTRVAVISEIPTDYVNLFTNQSILGNKTFLNTIFTNGSLYTGGKTAAAIGIGVCVDALGALHISNATYPYISFYYANNISYTSRIMETGPGTLRVYNNLTVTQTFQTDGNAIVKGDLNVSGNILGQKEITAYSSSSSSDSKLKNHVRLYDNDILFFIRNLHPVYFTWKDNTDKSRQLGFYAQDIQPYMPEVVRDTVGHLTLDYGRMGAILSVVGIKALLKRIEELEREIETVKRRI